MYYRFWKKFLKILIMPEIRSVWHFYSNPN